MATSEPGVNNETVMGKSLETLAKEGQLMSYVYEGFWQCMDNMREKNMLEKLLVENKAPWKKWKRVVPQKID